MDGRCIEAVGRFYAPCGLCSLVQMTSLFRDEGLLVAPAVEDDVAALWGATHLTHTYMKQKIMCKQFRPLVFGSETCWRLWETLVLLELVSGRTNMLSSTFA